MSFKITIYPGTGASMRLITNLSFVQLTVNGNPLRLDCQALLLEESAPLFRSDPPNHCIRGFGPDSAWSVFTLWLHCGHLDYEVNAAESNNAVIMSDTHPEGRPLFSGAVMKFKDDTELFLQAQDQEQPLDISDHEEYDVVWAELAKGTRRYYGPPYFPVLHFVPKSLV